MRNGFIKVAAITPEIRVCDTSYNTAQIVSLIDKAYAEGIKLAVFPELCITGATCADIFHNRLLLSSAENSLKTIISATSGKNCVVVVGIPVSRLSMVYSCAAVILDGELLAVVPSEYFGENVILDICGKNVLFGSKILLKCAALPEFSFAVEIGEDSKSSVPLSAYAANAGATIIAGLYSFPKTVNSAELFSAQIIAQSSRLLCGYICALAGEGESTSGAVYSADSLIAESGHIQAKAEPFSTGLTPGDIDVFYLFDRRTKCGFDVNEDGFETISFSLPLEKNNLTKEFPCLPFVPSCEVKRAGRCADILSIQAHALKKRIAHAGAKCAVIGVSGGLDSTLALLAAVKAFDLLGRPRTGVVAVTMPCFGTTARTKSNALRLAEILGAETREIDITAAVTQHLADIGHDITDTNVTYENAQARERTQVLMDIANDLGGLVVGTGDLSELALGWATYGGDQISMYSVNAGIPKTLIRHIVEYAAVSFDGGKAHDVLCDILTTPVSPELLPPENGDISQRTEELVGPYELHDFFLYYGIHAGFSPKKLLYVATSTFSGKFDSTTILSWLQVFYRRFFSQHFKRSCSPDGPKIGSVSLSPKDFAMPGDARADLWLAELDSIG